MQLSTIRLIKTIVSAYPEIEPHLSAKTRWAAIAARLGAGVDGMKTFDHYQRQIYGLVRDLFEGVIIESDFVGEMADIIPAQLTKAWREAMRANGLDPDGDMLEEWQIELDSIILSEYDHVDAFAAAIVANANSEEPNIDGLLARADLWANRYNDVYNEALLITSEGTQKYIWELGATEEHCAQCAALNGIVAFSREWEQSRFRPQQPPNAMLECGGWRCDCALSETTERRTHGALDRLLDIAQGLL